MIKMKVFCFGFGQVAKYFAKKILKEKIALELNVTSRKNTNNLTFEGLDLNSFEFNNKKIDKNIDTKVQDADFVLVSSPPVEDEDIVLKNFKEILFHYWKENKETDKKLKLNIFNSDMVEFDKKFTPAEIIGICRESNSYESAIISLRRNL